MTLQAPSHSTILYPTRTWKMRPGEAACTAAHGLLAHPSETVAKSQRDGIAHPLPPLTMRRRWPRERCSLRIPAWVSAIFHLHASPQRKQHISAAAKNTKTLTGVFQLPSSRFVSRDPSLSDLWLRVPCKHTPPSCLLNVRPPASLPFKERPCSRGR